MRVSAKIGVDPLYVVLDLTDKGPVVSAQFQTEAEAIHYAETAAENHDREFMVTRSISSVSHQRVHTVTRKFYKQAEE